jgi:hypothetical protein
VTGDAMRAEPRTGSAGGARRAHDGGRLVALAATPPRCSGRGVALVAAAAAALLAGCAHPPPPPTAWDWHATATETEVAAFRDTSSLLAGRDAPRPGRLVAAGDCALFGLCLLDGNERREWFLRLTAMADEPPGWPMERFVVPADSPLARLEYGPPPAGSDPTAEVEVMLPRSLTVAIEVFDGELRRIANVRVIAGRAFFDGAVAGCRAAIAAARNAAPPRGGEGRTSAEVGARVAVGHVIAIVRATKSLLAILREIARLPPLWTLLRGVRVRYDMALDRAVPATAPDGGAACAFPLRLLINGNPALLCTVTAAAPAPPLRVCGGFTRLVARDPEDADRRVVLTLLAARCARPPAVASP